MIFNRAKLGEKLTFYPDKPLFFSIRVVIKSIKLSFSFSINVLMWSMYYMAALPEGLLINCVPFYGLDVSYLRENFQ